MVRALHLGVACSTLLIFCRAFFVPKAATSRCQLKNINNNNSGGTMLRAVVTLRTRSSPRSSPRGAVGVTSRYFLRNKPTHSSSFSIRSGGGVVAAGESSFLPPPKWSNLYDNSMCPPKSVSLDEYIALGPRYRQQHQQQQQQQQQQHQHQHQEQKQRLAKREEPTATATASLFGDNSSSSRTEQPQHNNNKEDWLAASADLAASLGIDPSTSTEAQHRRVFHLYLPIYFWLKQLLFVSHRRRRSMPSPSSSPPRDIATSTAPRHVNNGVSECGGSGNNSSSSSSSNNSNGRENDAPLVVGISAPQGCGKTTLVSEMQRMLEKAGHSCAVVSIDDFYLTGAEQDDLAARYPTNPLLQVRGNAGTHDLALGLRTIRDLRRRGDIIARSNSSKVRRPSAPASTVSIGGVDRGDEQEERGVVVRVPRYDKSARGGKGDRAPEGEWGFVTTPPDIVLLEGWMLGFEALPDDSPLLRAAAQEAEDGGEVSGLGVVNTFLKDYQELHDEVDAWLVLKTAEPEMVFEWRAEAERRMREAGRPGMSEEQVRDFCSRYMPAYRAYLPGLYDSCRRTIDALVVEPEAGDGRRRHRLEGDDAEEAAKETTTNRRDFASGVGGVENTLVIEVGRDRNPVL